MDKSIMIAALQKTAVVMHALAFKFEDKQARTETLALVDALAMTIKYLESQK